MGGQQSQMTSRQVAMTANINNTLQQHTRQLGTLNTTMSSGFRNLSSSFTRSVAGLSSAIGRGAMGAAGAAGGAAAGVGRVSASAVSGITSGVVSALRMTLPAALAGLVGKALVWDNIEDSTKKELQENFSGVVKNALGSDAFKDITKEIKVLTLTMGDMLDGIGSKISSMAKAFGVKTGPALDKVKDTARSAVDKTKDATSGVDIKKLAREVEDALVEGGIVAKGTAEATKTAYNIAESIAPAVAQNPVETAAAIGVGISAYKKMAKSAPPPAAAASTGKAPTPFALAKQNADVLKQMKQAGVPATKINVVKARLYVDLLGKVLSKIGDNATKVVKGIEKLGGFKAVFKFPVIGFFLYILQRGIFKARMDKYKEEGWLSEEESEWMLNKFDVEQVAAMSAGGIAGALLIESGPFAIAGALVAGAVAESAAGAVYEYANPAPATLKQDMPEKGSSTQKARDVRKTRREKADQKQQGSITAKPAAVSGGADSGKVSEYLIESLKKMENSKLYEEKGMSQAYWDENHYSIGYGTPAANKDESIDEKEADTRLREFVTKTRKQVIAVKDKYGRNWNDAQIDALTSFAYNLGPGALEQLTAGGKRSDEEIAKKMVEYNKVSGKKNPGIEKRRKFETAMFNMSPGGSAPSGAPIEGGAPGEAASASGGDESQGPTAGMTVSQKADHYRKQLTAEEGGGAPKPGESPTGAPGKSGGFAAMLAGGSFESMKQQLMAGLDSDMERKAEGQTAGPSINYSGGDTNVNSNSGGGGGGAPTYSPTAPAASYQSQFTSIAGIQRTA